VTTEERAAKATGEEPPEDRPRYDRGLLRVGVQDNAPRR